MWIKLESHTINKPEIFQISAYLEISRAEVVGHLVTIWSWFDQNTEDGCVKISNGELIIDSISVKGFSQAMQDVGWLNATESRLCIPNFVKHNGSSAKKRANGQARQSRFRNAKTVTREEKEKSREEVKSKHEKTPFLKIQEMWNKAVDGTPCPKAERLTTKRKTAMRLLFKEYKLEEIESVFAKVSSTKWMHGENSYGWVANLDHILKPDKFLKLYEGGSESTPTGSASDFGEWEK